MPKLDANLKKELRSIAGKLKRLIQRTIVDMGLYDTWLMHDSMRVDVIQSANGFELVVSSVDYFKYVNGRFGVMDAVYISTEWIEIENRIQAVYAALLEIELEE